LVSELTSLKLMSIKTLLPGCVRFGMS